MEVDLHIQQLTKSAKGMTNFDMLNLQLDTAKRQLEFAIQKRIQKVVFMTFCFSISFLSISKLLNCMFIMFLG